MNNKSNIYIYINNIIISEIYKLKFRNKLATNINFRPHKCDERRNNVRRIKKPTGRFH